MPPAKPRARRHPRDEEVVAAIVKVVLKEGTIDSQRDLHRWVERALKSRDATYAVGPERVRFLALRSGLVAVRIRARVNGPTPDMAKCPVCASKLKKRTSGTLTGGSAFVGYRCSACPYWTGRDYRIPAGYSFQAKLEKGNGKQTTFARADERQM